MIYLLLKLVDKYAFTSLLCFELIMGVWIDDFDCGGLRPGEEGHVLLSDETQAINQWRGQPNMDIHGAFSYTYQL